MLYTNKETQSKRKLILSMNVTQDGYLSGPNCELDWHFNAWTTQMAECLADELNKADTILFGRITFNAMSAYWSNKGVDLSSPIEDRAFAKMINSYTKVVFSKTLTHSTWNNSIMINDDPAVYIRKLKEQKGSAIMIYGSAQLVWYLIDNKLIDEFQLWVHPVKLGRGKLLFKSVSPHFLELVNTKEFRNGVVLFYYRFKQLL
ncbi:dihydrofolate reductase family protein [Flavobacterium sp.]|uniref:dihydrofolate reductase family protein n=1 Tax=Flavobacterium sp. TaxID=239 RepID=UPI003A91A902